MKAGDCVASRRSQWEKSFMVKAVVLPEVPGIALGPGLEARLRKYCGIAV